MSRADSVSYPSTWKRYDDLLIQNGLLSCDLLIKLRSRFAEFSKLGVNYQSAVLDNFEFFDAWIDLAPFSEPVIKTFMKIEQPQEPPHIEGFFLALKKIDVPALTIGGFYAQIVSLLEQMETKTPGKVFIGKPEFQIHKDYYRAGGGEIVAVHDLASAKAALDLVIQQGEGAWTSGPGQAARGFGDNFDIGHYYRFSEIFYGHRYQKSDDPKGPPTGASIDVDYAQAYPFKKDPKRSDYPPGSALRKLNDDFNQRYSDMLRQLQEALNGSPKTLYTAVMDSMHHLTPVAH